MYIFDTRGGGRRGHNSLSRIEPTPFTDDKMLVTFNRYFLSELQWSFLQNSMSVYSAWTLITFRHFGISLIMFIIYYQIYFRFFYYILPLPGHAYIYSLCSHLILIFLYSFYKFYHFSFHSFALSPQRLNVHVRMNFCTIARHSCASGLGNLNWKRGKKPP